MYNRIFSIQNTQYYSILTWILAFFVDLPNFLGVGAHVYDIKSLQCIFDRLKVGYTITVCNCSAHLDT